MAIYKIKKRNGTIATFDVEKIQSAIIRAMASLGIMDDVYARELASEVQSYLDVTYKDTIPTVEQIQDTVESVLMSNGYEQVARAYILYREEHQQNREKPHRVMLDIETTINEYIQKQDWRVNANANSGYSLG